MTDRLQHLTSLAFYYAGCLFCQAAQMRIPGMARAYTWCMCRSMDWDKGGRLWMPVDKWWEEK